MRIFCCANRDLASNLAINLLLPALARHQVALGLSEPRATSPPLDAPPEANELHRIETLFPNEILFPLLERGPLPLPGDRHFTFRELERACDISVHDGLDANSPSGLQSIQAFAPDLILSIRYAVILRAPVLAIPRLGVLNLHSGLLPRYRGVLATFRALLAGDTEIGCTLHRVTDRTIDTGPIVSTARVPVVPGRSLLWHVQSLYRPGADLVVAALDRLAEKGDVLVQPQRDGGAYYSRPTAEEWEAFSRAGWRTVDERDVNAIVRRFTTPDAASASSRADPASSV